MKPIIIKLINVICFGMGIFFSYVVITGILYKLANIKLPFPGLWDKSYIVGIGVLFILPIIAFWLFKFKPNSFTKGASYLFILFWGLAMILFFNSILMK